MKLLPDNSNLAAVLEDSRLYALGQGGSPADMRGANLSGANLSGANLSDAYLRGADLTGANLTDADLRGADLSGANLSGVNLPGACLSGANLTWAGLSGADLTGASLYRADLRGANLTGANLTGVKLNWQSHALIGEVLRQEAGKNIARQMLAGLVAIATDLCWPDFLKLRLKEKRWALTTLAKYIQPDDSHPAVLDKYKEGI